jgi:hypothetical protein
MDPLEILDGLVDDRRCPSTPLHGIRNLVRANADGVAILFMKIGNDSMIVTSK